MRTWLAIVVAGALGATASCTPPPQDPTTVTREEGLIPIPTPEAYDREETSEQPTEDPPTEVPPEEPGETDTPDETVEIRAVLRVCVWNIQKLGYTNRRPPPRNVQKMADIIEEYCDVVGVIEVMSQIGGVSHPGYSSLARALGRSWNRGITTRGLPGGNGATDEKYAFFWRRLAVRRCPGIGIRTHPDRRNAFGRDPGVACFSAPPAGQGMDFLLALYHAPRPDRNPAAELVGLPELISFLSRVKPNELDLFIAGDFNLRPTRLERELRAARATAGLSDQQLINLFSKSREGTTLNVRGDMTNNHYDQFIVVNPAATRERIAQSIVDGRREIVPTDGPSRLRSQRQRNIYFRDAVSDHLMVRVDFDVTGPDDD